MKQPFSHLCHLLVLLLAIMLPAHAAAQKYVITPFKSKAQLYEYAEPDKASPRYGVYFEELKPALELEEGTVVELHDSCLVRSEFDSNAFADMMMTLLSSQGVNVVSVDYEGKTYYIEPAEMAWSEENPEDAKPPRSIRSHTDKSSTYRFFMTGKPFFITFFLIIAAWLLSIFAMYKAESMAQKGGLQKGNKLFGALLIAIPLLLCISLALEVIGFISATSDLFWWMDTTYVGLFKMIIFLLMFVWAIRQQFNIVGGYNSILECYIGRNTNVKYKAIIYGSLIGMAIAVGAFIYAGTSLQHNHDLQNTVIAGGLIAMCAITLISIAITSITAIKAAGWLYGTLYALFLLLWSVGCIIGGAFLIWQILRVIIPILILTFFFNMPLTGGGGSTGSKLFFDSKGWGHVSQSAANAADASY